MTAGNTESRQAEQEPVRSGAARPGDEIDLLAYAETGWRYRYVLLAVVLLTGAVVWFVNLRLAPTYEVVFRLMASEPRVGGEPAREESVVQYRELVESQTIAAGLLEEFGLNGQPHNLTPHSFLDDHVAVEIIRDSTIVRVAVRLKDRDLLVRLAQRYAERVVEVAQRLNTEGLDYTTEQIRRQRDAALDRLSEAEEALRAYQQEAQIEVLRRDVDTMLERRPEALDLTVQIQGERARVEQAEAELARHERVREVRRSVDTIPQRRESEPGPRPRVSTRQDPQAPGANGGRPGSPSGGEPTSPQARRHAAEAEDLTIRSELLDPYVNPVYEALERDLSSARARLASLENQRKELVSRLQLEAPAADRLNRLYKAEAGLEVVTRARDVARDAYLNAANKYEDARLQSTLRSPRLYILDRALPPDRPVAPRRLRNTLTAMLLAFTFGVIGVIAYDSRRQRS